MAKNKNLKKYMLSRGIVGIAVAVIADYDRRKRDIEKGALSDGLVSSYTRYNTIVDSALECIEPGARREILNDISRGRGYNSSLISYMYCKTTYYLRKREVIYRVAEQLMLVEK